MLIPNLNVAAYEEHGRCWKTCQEQCEKATSGCRKSCDYAFSKDLPFYAEIVSSPAGYSFYDKGLEENCDECEQ